MAPRLTGAVQMGDNTFQVDLRGMVDLLSHHLYSGPRVYLREVLQNAVDAVAARAGGAGADVPPGRVVVRCHDGAVEVADNGIGLTEAQVHEFLATIGRSSKRDDLGFARGDFLGQFGIGLLSGFLVADQVEVVTRAACGAPAVRWTGNADGTYAVAPAGRDEPGTTVVLRARPGAERWVHPDTVRELATEFGRFLPVPVEVDGTVVTRPAPWRRDGRGEAARTADLVAHAQDDLGLTPFDCIDLDVPEAGLTGVAYVLPQAAPASRGQGHLVHLKGMLLSARCDDLLPPWAFFVRCSVDSTQLRPTASREQLYDDDLLAAAREGLGRAVRTWIATLARTDHVRLQRFLQVHHLGVKALALHDDEMLDLVTRWWPVETSLGPMTLADAVSTHRTLRYTADLDTYRHLAPVAAAQGLLVVNGAYTYDAEILHRLAVPRAGVEHSGITVEAMSGTDLGGVVEPVDPTVELALRPALARAQGVLDAQGCEVLLRTFAPVTVPALYLVDRDVDGQAALRAARAVADDLWAGVLSTFEKPRVRRPQLVLNHAHPLVRAALAVTDPALACLAVEALYGQAVLQSGATTGAAQTALVARTQLALLQRAVAHAGPDTPDRGEDAR